MNHLNSFKLFESCSAEDILQHAKNCIPHFDEILQQIRDRYQDLQDQNIISDLDSDSSIEICFGDPEKNVFAVYEKSFNGDSKINKQLATEFFKHKDVYILASIAKNNKIPIKPTEDMFREIESSFNIKGELYNGSNVYFHWIYPYNSTSNESMRSNNIGSKEIIDHTKKHIPQLDEISSLLQEFYQDHCDELEHPLFTIESINIGYGSGIHHPFHPVYNILKNRLVTDSLTKVFFMSSEQIQIKANFHKNSFSKSTNESISRLINRLEEAIGIRGDINLTNSRVSWRYPR